MTFEFFISPTLERTLDKLAHRDKALALAVRKKIRQIINCDVTTINHYKNLRGDMSDYKRVHVGSLVLLFKVEKYSIIFDRLVHHDKAY